MWAHIVTVGGANAWSGLSLDEKRGIVFIPTASPKYNFYGADRTGANLFGDCLIALNARTGKLIWYFQMVHHDIWDYDNATAPMLLTIRHDGKMVDVVAQAGKEGSFGCSIGERASRSGPLKSGLYRGRICQER